MGGATSKGFYRPDIDGLRAVAVLVVIFFHAGFSGLPGGYVGVDVFFVISGYLITSIIVRDIDSGSFSIVNFWERRIRRLGPPLAVVFLFTLVASWLLLFPNDFRDFAQSLLAQSLFASNILFLTESGYFAPAAELKPLQHMWSLAIEEQFYLFFPWVLILVSKQVRRFRVLCVVALTLVSMIISVYLVSSWPELAFFLLPSRAWELLIGSLLVFIPLRRSEKLVTELMSAAGLTMVLVASVTYDADTRFPGLSAMLPCFGAALIIQAHTSGSRSMVYRLLSSRIMVFIGLISYSLYLWHWPLFVFVRYHSEGSLTTSMAILIIVVSAVLSVLSWKFVETPIRSRRILSQRKTLFVTAVVTFAAFIAIGLAGHFSTGFAWRFSPEVRKMYDGFQYTNPRRNQCLFSELRLFSEKDVCKVGVNIDGKTNSKSDVAADEKIDFLVVGDSHANSIMPQIDQIALEYGLTGLYPMYNGCPPMLEVYRVDTGTKHTCHAFNKDVLNLIRQKNIKNVLLVGRWSFYALDSMLAPTDEEGKRPADWLLRERLSVEMSKVLVTEGLNRFIDQLSPETHLSILKQVPKQASYITPRYLASRIWQGDDVKQLGVSLQEHLLRQSFADQMLEEIADSRANVSVIDVTPYLCGEEKCYLTKNGGSLYRDDDHVSTYGGKLIAPAIRRFFDRIAI